MFPEPMMMAEDNVTLIPTEIKSCVLVTKLVGVEMDVTPGPLIIKLRQPDNYNLYLTMRPSPSWWNPLSGLWDINPNTSCLLANIGGGMLEYNCNRFGYFALTMSPTLIHNIVPPINKYDDYIKYTTITYIIFYYINLHNLIIILVLLKLKRYMHIHQSILELLLEAHFFYSQSVYILY